MDQAKTIIFIVIAAAIIIELFFVFGGNLPLFLYEQADYMVTDAAKDRLTQTLSSGDRRVGIAPPETNVWKPGETGIYLLGIRNRYSEDKQFYSNIYLEGLEGDLKGKLISNYQDNVASWMSYSKSISLGSQDSEIVSIIIKTGQDAEPGIYIMRTVVCEEENCNTLSDSGRIYSSVMFTLIIREG